MTCSRVTIINRGRIVATNTPDNLMAQLAGGSGYELEVDGDPLAIKQMLKVLPGISVVEPIPAKELPEKHSLMRVISEPGAEPGRDIAAVIVGAGMGLYEMRRTFISLEDVFLELTMEDKPIESE